MYNGGVSRPGPSLFDPPEDDDPARRRWSAVDAYFAEALAPSDAGLLAALDASDASDVPAIQVSPTQGKLLEVLARAVGARRILEVGTLAGYSTIWMARALPADGELVTLELDPAYAAVAQANVDRAGCGDRVDIRVGPALDSLASLHAAGAGPFDLAFIDANKDDNPAYVDWAVRMARPGSLIVLDNVVRDGAVVDGSSTDPRVLGVRRATEAMAADSRLTATAVQTVGEKGWDGFALAVVLDPGT